MSDRAVVAVPTVPPGTRDTLVRVVMVMLDLRIAVAGNLVRSVGVTRVRVVTVTLVPRIAVVKTRVRSVTGIHARVVMRMLGPRTVVVGNRVRSVTAIPARAAMGSRVRRSARAVVTVDRARGRMIGGVAETARVVAVGGRASVVAAVLRAKSLSLRRRSASAVPSSPCARATTIPIFLTMSRRRTSTKSPAMNCARSRRTMPSGSLATW